MSKEMLYCGTRSKEKEQRKKNFIKMTLQLPLAICVGS